MPPVPLRYDMQVLAPKDWRAVFNFTGLRDKFDKLVPEWAINFAFQTEGSCQTYEEANARLVAMIPEIEAGLARRDHIGLAVEKAWKKTAGQGAMHDQKPKPEPHGGDVHSSGQLLKSEDVEMKPDMRGTKNQGQTQKRGSGSIDVDVVAQAGTRPLASLLAFKKEKIAKDTGKATSDGFADSDSGGAINSAVDAAMDEGILGGAATNKESKGSDESREAISASMPDSGNNRDAARNSKWLHACAAEYVNVDIEDTTMNQATIMNPATDAEKVDTYSAKGNAVLNQSALGGTVHSEQTESREIAKIRRCKPILVDDYSSDDHNMKKSNPEKLTAARKKVLAKMANEKKQGPSNKGRKTTRVISGDIRAYGIPGQKKGKGRAQDPDEENSAMDSGSELENRRAHKRVRGGSFVDYDMDEDPKEDEEYRPH